METLAQTLNKEHKELNNIQKMNGYETTPYLRKKIKFSRVSTQHIMLVKNELNHHAIDHNDDVKTMVLKKKRKENEIATRKNNFEQLTGEE